MKIHGKKSIGPKAIVCTNVSKISIQKWAGSDFCWKWYVGVLKFLHTFYLRINWMPFSSPNFGALAINNMAFFHYYDPRNETFNL